jgi:dissimilatory sulfite reductase (desulfoviridin) alpha/beta subunit
MKESEFNKYLLLSNKELEPFLIERMKDGSINLSEATLLAITEEYETFFMEVNGKWSLKVTYNQLKNQANQKGYVLNDSLPFDFRAVCEGCPSKMQITSLFDENIICIDKKGFTQKYTEPVIKIVNELRQDNPNIKISHRNGHKCLEKFGDFPAEYGYSGKNVEEHIGYDKIVLNMDEISKGFYTEDFIKYYQSSDYQNNLEKGEATQPFNIQDGKEVLDTLVENLIDYDTKREAIRLTVGPNLKSYVENIVITISEKEMRFLMEETRNEFYIEEFMDEFFSETNEDYLSLLLLGESSEEIAKTILNFKSVESTIRHIIAMELIKYPNEIKASSILGDHIQKEYEEKLEEIKMTKVQELQNAMLVISPMTQKADGKSFWKKKRLKDVVGSLKSDNPAYAWNEIAAFIETIDSENVTHFRRLNKRNLALLIAYKLLQEDEVNESTQD